MLPADELSLPFTDDKLQANAVRFLVDGAEYDAANVLLACQLMAEASTETWWSGSEQVRGVNVDLVGPRAAYEALARDGAHHDSIRTALATVMPRGYYLSDLTPRVEIMDIDPGWRDELREIVKAKGASNQGRVTRPSTVLRSWKNLWFRSEAEVRLAQALDRAGVMFFPNCVGRVTAGNDRANKEPDFLVCDQGRWGILEVDGEPFHPPSRTVQDHERDRLFRTHGVRIVEHYDAQRCYEHPNDVVREFIELLRRA